MEYKDYYSILGLDKNVTDKDIKKAYRRLARQYHPDMNQGSKQSEDKFKQINEANEVLSDPEKRRKYDELGANWKNYEQWQKSGGEASGQPFDWSQYASAAGSRGDSRYQYQTVTEEELAQMFGDSGPFSPFYYSFFGDSAAGPAASQARRQYRTASRPHPGHDVEQPVEVSLEEAYHGTARVLQIDDASSKVRRLEAKIPSGVRDGSRIRLAGQGTPGTAGGPAGDLFLIIQVRPHHLFERKEDDLHLKLGVPLTTIMLGGEVEVPTLDGKVMLKIPRETQNGKAFRLKGKGIPHMLNPQGHGDLYVEATVELPERLSPKERQLFEELARLRGADKTESVGTPP